ncbi:MAG: glycoside hydrolase family 92 protein, partial [Bacteroidia bacterium]|nr:glycoside hydrolase family 92 protein [Bacteroidia bacterium]
MRTLITLFAVVAFVTLTLNNVYAQQDFTKYVDPRIGNVSTFLVPTYPTFSLPNQMLRMFPVKTDYIADQVTAWPLQVMTHRMSGILQMKVSLGDITNKSWSEKMTIDHDREVVHPWHYSTYLVDDAITVSFAPASKCAIYKIDFPMADQKNILISGTENLKATFTATNTFQIEEKFNYVKKGIAPETKSMDVFCYGEVLNADGTPTDDVKITHQKGKLAIAFTEKSAKSVLVKYAISYISAEQAKINFAKEIANMDFEKTRIHGKTAWDKVINQIQVKGGTVAQKRSFYTSLYRTYERMIDINEYGHYYSGYDAKIHQSNRPFFIDDWVWDTYLA